MFKHFRSNSVKLNKGKCCPREFSSVGIDNALIYARSGVQTPDTTKTNKGKC